VVYRAMVERAVTLGYRAGGGSKRYASSSLTLRRLIGVGGRFASSYCATYRASSYRP
jgi:hypothetical protein